ncbi:MAG: hypothetical protein IRZ01_04280 [Thermoflavifilum aggregans]|nr:hypothetical protein [Thermoflavifilum aggregans]
MLSTSRIIIIIIAFTFTSQKLFAQDSSFFQTHPLQIHSGFGYAADIDEWLHQYPGIPGLPDNPNSNKIHSGWTAWVSLTYDWGKKKNNSWGVAFSKIIIKAYYGEPTPAFFNARNFVIFNNYEIPYKHTFFYKRSVFSPGIGFYISTQKTVLPIYTLYVDSSRNYYTLLKDFNEYKDVAPGIAPYFDYSYRLNDKVVLGIRLKVNYSLYWYIENVIISPFIDVKL